MRSVVVCLLFVAGIAAAQELPSAEAAKLQCARETFGAVGEAVWPGWPAAPFGVMLVLDEQEYLVDAAGKVQLARKRTFNPQFLATFPLTSPEPVIVIGSAKNTGRSDTAWIITVLHEHFHQLQYSQPWYYERTAALGLAKGDASGMWMLNYPFPYGDAKVQRAYEAFTRSLAAALRARNSAGFAPALRAVTSTWRALRAMLSVDDYTYLRFQLWQEGMARYAELRAAESASAVECLSAYTPPAEAVATQTMNGIYRMLDDPQLGENQRAVVYATGAAIALLLDEVAPDWKRAYFEKPFELEQYFTP